MARIKHANRLQAFDAIKSDNCSAMIGGVNEFKVIGVLQNVSGMLMHHPGKNGLKVVAYSFNN